MASKAQRLSEFQRRLLAATPADCFETAYGQIFRIMNEVEDELSGIPYNMRRADVDGRLYPPLWDMMRKDPSRPRVMRLRSKAHRTLIGDNGAVEITEVLSGSVVFDKPGRDGLRVSEL